MNITSLSSFAVPPARAYKPASTSTDTINFGSILANSLHANTSPPITQTRSTAPVSTQGQMEKRSSLTDALRGLNQGDADQIARNMAYEDHTTTGGVGPLLDASGYLPGGDGILRYSGSGEPVTAESQAYFNKTETSFRQERIRIYESEKTKGTPPADIYDKLVSAMDQQPERYRSMMSLAVSE